MATDSACPGACRNRNTTPATSSRPINIPASASPIWPTSAASAKTPSSRPMPAGWRPWSIPPPRRAISSAWPRSARAASMAGTRRSTIPAPACPKVPKVAIIRAYMAHHQAMTIVGIANALQDGAMRARFHAEPIMQAAELLLQERMPRDVAVATAAAGTGERRQRRTPASCPTFSATMRRRIRACRAPIFCRTDAIRRWSRRPDRATAAGTISRSPAGARTSPATAGAPISSCAMCAAAKSGRPATSQAGWNPTAMR